MPEEGLMLITFQILRNHLLVTVSFTDKLIKYLKSSCILVCLARYKTRPGLTYHYNHSHKERDLDSYNPGEPEDTESRDSRGVDSPSAGSDSLDGVPRVQVSTMLTEN